MAAPYSTDLRVRVVAAYRSGLPRSEVAKRFEVSESSVQRWSRLERQGGGVAAKPMGGRRPFALRDQRDWILARINERPELPLWELLAEVRQRHSGAHYYALWEYRQAGRPQL